jgi:hypothetical protein
MSFPEGLRKEGLNQVDAAHFETHVSQDTLATE